MKDVEYAPQKSSDIGKEKKVLIYVWLKIHFQTSKCEIMEE